MFSVSFVDKRLNEIWVDIVSLTKNRDLLMTLEYNKIKNLEEVLTPEFFDQLVNVDLCLFFCGLLELKNGYIEHLKIRELLSSLKDIVLSVMRENLCNDNYVKLDETLQALVIMQVSPELVTRCLFELMEVPLSCVGKSFVFFGVGKTGQLGSTGVASYCYSGKISNYSIVGTRVFFHVNVPDIQFMSFDWQVMKWKVLAEIGRAHV